jgi:thymidylate kinase
MTTKNESSRYQRSRRTLTVSFSGVDGAGKSTQIEHLLSSLMAQGVCVRVLRFWDNVARLTRIREGTGHTIFRGDKGTGSPEAPINRRDKNVRGWPMTCLRLLLYFVDALSTRNAFRRAMKSDLGCVIFDRYVYDELANLNVENAAIRAYIRLIMSFVPKPDISFILDADPVSARARKPEYPLEFLYRNRQAYFALNRTISGLTIIPPMGIEDAKNEVCQIAQNALTLIEMGNQGDLRHYDRTEADPAISRS